MRGVMSGAALAVALWAQGAGAQPLRTPPDLVVSIYRAAPGRQVGLLQWLARQDDASRAAGMPPGQLFIHQDGASWDYLVIQNRGTPEQDRATDAAARRLGMTTGPRRGIELRQFIAEHTDTFVSGPTTAAEALRQVAQPTGGGG